MNAESESPGRAYPPTYLLVAVVLHSIMSGVIKSHLYLYATTGETPVGSDPAVYARAFGKT